MIEGLVSVMAPRGSKGDDDETVERLALSSLEAIRTIVADRKSMRDRLEAQQRELAALTAFNEELRRRINVIRHHYLELGKRAIALIDQLDQATRDAMTDHAQAAAADVDEDPSLVALAQRFKPNGAVKPAEDMNPKFAGGEPAATAGRGPTPDPA
jgi:hypothetical protein